MKRKILPIILILILILSGCSGENGTDKRPVIAVSIVPQATFLKKICGDKFNIITMIPPGASPETYEPTPAEQRKLENAKLYFAIGVPSEESTILNSLSKNTKLVKLHSEVVKTFKDRTEHTGRDPHIWLSPKRVKIMVDTMAKQLIELDSENADFYRKNADSYISQLEKLDIEINKLLSPLKNRKFIAFHPAFGYFADDYGLTMYALEEHGKEVTAKRLAQMTDLALNENIKVIFYQAETSGRQAKSFAESISGKAVSLEPLSADYIPNLKKMANSIAEAMN